MSESREGQFIPPSEKKKKKITRGTKALLAGAALKMMAPESVAHAQHLEPLTDSFASIKRSAEPNPLPSYIKFTHEEAPEPTPADEENSTPESASPTEPEENQEETGGLTILQKAANRELDGLSIEEQESSIHEAAGLAALEHPIQVLQFSYLYNQYEWSRDLIKKAGEILATKRSLEAVSQYPQYAHIENARQILSTALSLIEADPEKKSYGMEHRGAGIRPEEQIPTDQITKEMRRKNQGDPRAILQLFLYADKMQPWMTDDLLRNAITQLLEQSIQNDDSGDARVVFIAYPLFSHLRDAPALIHRAAEQIGEGRQQVARGEPSQATEIPHPESIANSKVRRHVTEIQ